MRIIKTIIFILVPFFAFSQDDWEKQPQRGSLESVEIDVVGNKKIQIPNANRIYEPIPPRPAMADMEDMDYSFGNYFYSGIQGNYRLRPRPVNQEAEDKLYSGYFRGGYGTFNSPLVDAYLSNKRSKEYSLGAGFNYNGFNIGSIDRENSGMTLLNASVQGNLYGDKVSLLNDIRFTRNAFHYYGYPEGTAVTADEIAQSFNRFHVSTEFKNNDSDADLVYDLSLGFDNISDDFESNESDINGMFDIKLAVLEDVSTTLSGGFSVINRSSPGFGESNRVLFNVSPGAEFKKEKLIAGAGLNVAYSNDTLAKIGGLQLFPRAYAQYELKKGLHLSGDIYGGINKASFNSVTNENLFIRTDSYLSHEKVNVGLDAKLSGRIKTSFGYDLGLSFENSNNSFFYLNNVLDQSRFDVVYDTGSVNRVNPYINIYFNSSDYYRSVLKIDFFNYNTDVLEEAWHRPTLTVNFTNKFNIGDKMFISFDTYVFNGLKGLNTDNQLVELDPVINMNTNLEYVLGPKLSAFMMINNLLGNNYSYYLNYPGIGLQLLGGVSFKL